ncbi:MAG: toll/interleukin-1 receptor domain-containing protein [Hyphomonadaceae bacterium]
MPLAFVSYAHQDRDIAAKLIERLRKAAPDLEIVSDDAIDADTHEIASDAYRLPFVGKRLRNANAVISVLTRSYAESDPCWLEMSAALMMEKVVPINLDPGLSPAGLHSMVARKNIIAIAPGWFNKEPGEVEAAETAKFERFVADLKAEASKHRPFTEWQPAEPKDVRALTASLADSLRPKTFRRTGLVWSPGSALAEVQKRRFFAAIESMSIATGDGAWDVARRKALKALADEPTEARIRAEALMGLVGELTAPSDGSPPVATQEPWEFVGDMALPIDRDISRFAYNRAGKIPNDLRKMFQVLRPGRSKRRSFFAVGALFGSVIGAALAYGGYMLFGQPFTRVVTPATPPRDAVPSPSKQLPAPPQLTQAPRPPASSIISPASPSSPISPPVVAQSAPVKTAPAETSLPAAGLATSPSSSLFVVSARGLEASVQAELMRRNQDKDDWRKVYSQVISLNQQALCGADRWKAADMLGKKPLDVIRADVPLTWPTATDLVKTPRLLECPAIGVPA